MTYIIIDIFSKREAAEIQAEVHRQSGKKVKVVEVNKIIVNDCTGEHCIARHTQDGNPLYIVLAEG